ncbi:RNA polymerase sigma24 factor [Acrocarpospora pleiomorpha]|uniref:RNA polymerase sigma24 factor n=1 Tax=Acrocarpospora pleiomorpha TaxID=90975 RepID=A0A5M3XFP1_9ACTN|nr:SigE family RNA polymerase sigma factor [Acrocarpospora pleiomorpha]GES20427.1 RNA polymerase sigma24 factor [Acrocarpospora pleiomorpha]
MSAPAGFAEFVAARGTSLLRTAHLTCGSAQEAEDVLQSALERACRSWHRLRQDTDPEPYVRRIIVNLAISRARRRALLRIIPTHSPPETPTTRDDVELRQVLMSGLRALPPRQRAVVVLRYWEDLSEAQTAKLLGCSVGTVKSQAAKALVRLRALLGEEVASNVGA